MKNIKEYYLMAYPTDELGKELNEITFNDMFRCLDNYADIYELIGVCDSLVRERLFEQLAVVMECDYSEIYEQWLLGK